MMTFREAGAVCWRKKFTFQGRATRAEYWWWSLWVFLTALVAFPVGLTASVVLLWLGGPFGLLLVIPMALAFLVFIVIATVASLAAAIRRLHDRTLSGWWWLWLSLVPSVISFAWYGRPLQGWVLLLELASWVGPVAMFVITVLPSHADNRYGPAWTADGRDPAEAW